MNIDDILHPRTATATEKRAALDIVFTVAETIRTLRTVPSGELYARCMAILTLQDYDRVIDSLKRAGVVEEHAHVLRWIGPTF